MFKKIFDWAKFAWMTYITFRKFESKNQILATLKMLSAQTTTKVDDKIVVALNEAFDRLDRYSKYDNKETNNLVSADITKDEKKLKGVSVNYDSEKKEFGIATKWFSIGYDPKNGKVSLKKVF